MCCVFICAGNVLGFITVKNRTAYPVELWIADPRLIDPENPVADPQARLLILPGKTIKFEPFVGVPVFVVNVDFNAGASLKKSCDCDPALLAQDGKKYDIFIIDKINLDGEGNPTKCLGKMAHRVMRDGRYWTAIIEESQADGFCTIL